MNTTNTYKVYIQSLDGIPVDDWAYAAYLGFKNRNLKIIFFEEDEFHSIPASKFNIIVADIETTLKYFKKLDIELKAINIPNQLNNYSYLGRKIQYTKMKQVREDKLYPCFIKPRNYKEFDYGLCKNEWELVAFFKHISDDTEVMVSDIINFISEYRCFVTDGKLLDIKNYSGDPFHIPNEALIKRMIKDYTEAPKSYTLDVGVSDSGLTWLVEINDGWSVGNYGLEGKPYTTFLLERWKEITNNCLK